jgi:hypothetical protein
MPASCIDNNCGTADGIQLEFIILVSAVIYIPNCSGQYGGFR